MIVSERKPVIITRYIVNDKYERFGEEMDDGRLTELSDGSKYRLREAILLSKKMGRPLTEEEMKQFTI